MDTALKLVARAAGHNHGGHSHGDEVDLEELCAGHPHDSEHEYMNLRIAAIFIIGFGSMAGALFPVLARRSSWLKVPRSVFDFAKYFGSGVIIATAFIHLLAHGIGALASECLDEKWHEYPYAMALCMLSIFAIFLIELVAFRYGTAKLAKLGASHDAHGHDVGAHAAHGPELELAGQSESPKRIDEKTEERSDVESATTAHEHEHRSWGTDTAAQVIGVGILEFGVILHSIILGLTLAVDESFKVLFIVIVFHQTFEGLGLGSRLAYMAVGPRYNWIPIVGAVVYGLTTPIGIAIGLGIRTSYNPASATASIVSGILDSVSAGILVYTGLVELFAHEFLFNKQMMSSSNGKLAYAVGSMCLGAILMSLLGRWA